MKLEEKLYELRRKTHFSQEQLADKMNVSRQAISKWEKGDNKPDLDNLKKLAEIFDVKLEYLIQDDYVEEKVEIPPKNKKTYIYISVIAVVCLFSGYLLGSSFAKPEIPKEILNSKTFINDVIIKKDDNCMKFFVAPSIYDEEMNVKFMFKEMELYNESLNYYDAIYKDNMIQMEKTVTFENGYNGQVYLVITYKGVTSTIYLGDFEEYRHGYSWTEQYK